MKRWLQHQALPAFQHAGQWVARKISETSGQNHWTMLQPSRRWSSWIIWTLVGFAGFGTVWACFARIDETVQATGKLEPKGTTKDIKAPMGGVVLKILVKDGQYVQAGQVLLEMDTTAASSKLAALKLVRERLLADLQLSRGQLGGLVNRDLLSTNQIGKLTALNSEYASRVAAAHSGVAQAQSQLDEVNTQLAAKRDALKIREKILKDIAPLTAQGAMARSQYLKELQDVLLLRGEIRSLVANSVGRRQALSESRFKLANTEAMTRIDFSSKVEESDKQLAEISSQLAETQLTLKYQKIKSPVNGMVFDLKPTSPGYVIQTEIPMLKIVPTDHLVARIFVANKDVGFVRIGQQTQVRVDSFPYNEFGELKGTVQSIGSDVLAPDQTYNYFRFPVTVSLDRNSLSYKGHKLKLRSGMSINANVVLRQRPVIAIFTQQILPFWDNLSKL